VVIILKQISVTSTSFDTIDFTPTVIIGFYRKGEKIFFIDDYEILKERFPQADIIGCSSTSNISNTRPYIESNQQFPCVYLCLDMQKGAFHFKLFAQDEEIDSLHEEEEKKYQAILLSSFSSLKLEEIITVLPSILGTQHLFGAVASVEDSAGYKGPLEIFYNGSFYEQHMLLWLIDAQKYTVDGMSMHLFRPEGQPLQITRCKGSKIYELDNKPALHVLESLAGRLDDSVIKHFGYPLFLQNEEKGWEGAPLGSLLSVDRKENTVFLHRNIKDGNYIKMGIMVDRDTQLKRLRNLYTLAPESSAALMFSCVGIEKNLSMMEYLYIEDIKRHLDITFIGFHSFGEIGYPASIKVQNDTLLHNQTMTMVFISDKDVSCN